MELASLCVFGFVRNAQRQLPNEQAYYNIPESITLVILAHFGVLERFYLWDKNHITVNQLRTTCSHLTNAVRTIYGAVEIKEYPHALYRWTFTSISVEKWGLLCLGIDSSNRKWTEDDYTEREDVHPFYSFGPTFKYDLNGRHSIGIGGSHIVWTDLESITMELNTKNKTLGFYFDENKGGINLRIVAFINVDFKNEDRVYTLAVLMGLPGETITLDNFEMRALD